MTHRSVSAWSKHFDIRSSTATTRAAVAGRVAAEAAAPGAPAAAVAVANEAEPLNM